MSLVMLIHFFENYDKANKLYYVEYETKHDDNFVKVFLTFLQFYLNGIIEVLLHIQHGWLKPYDILYEMTEGKK